jgi:hypothetical protein
MQAVCPQCGSNADVRTVGEMFDMLNSMQDQAMQRAQQGTQQGPYPPGQGAPGGPGGSEVYAGGYSDYNQGQPSQYRNRQSYDRDMFTGNIGEDAASAAVEAMTGFLGRAIGKKMQKAFQERVVPAMQARAAQAQQQMQQSRAEQGAIVQKYPDLRGCMKDNVVFLAGGSRYVPISEIRMPVTMASADALVNRLQG